MNNGARVALGTVQWGMNYGIANDTGQPASDEVARMLQIGREQGVDLLDTAHAYGEAERVLGAQHASTRGYRIVTKTSPLHMSRIDDAHVQRVINGFEESLTLLGCGQVYALLVHGPDALLTEGGERLWGGLERIKADGRASRIGVSVYHPEQLERILERYSIDVVQLPFSVYDQRFTQHGLLRRLQQLRIEVHARSAFLQGLLLLSPQRLPPRFDALRSRHAELHQRFREKALTPVEGCLKYCMQQPHIDRIVVGCESAEQLSEVLAAAHADAACDLADLGEFALTDDRMLNPSAWVQ